jgi:hypothetical protein
VFGRVQDGRVFGAQVTGMLIARGADLDGFEQHDVDAEQAQVRSKMHAPGRPGRRHGRTIRRYMRRPARGDSRSHHCSPDRPHDVIDDDRNTSPFGQIYPRANPDISRRETDRRGAQSTEPLGELANDANDLRSSQRLDRVARIERLEVGLSPVDDELLERRLTRLIESDDVVASERGQFGFDDQDRALGGTSRRCR